MSDQPSQQPPDETPDDVPAALAPDAPTEVRPSEEASGPAPAAPTPAGPAAPTTPAAQPAASAAQPPPPVPPPTFGTTEPGASTYESTPSGGLQSVFPPERPEYAVGAAFAGGLVLALILKRLAH